MYVYISPSNSSCCVTFNVGYAFLPISATLLFVHWMLLIFGFNKLFSSCKNLGFHLLSAPVDLILGNVSILIQINKD